MSGLAAILAAIDNAKRDEGGYLELFEDQYLLDTQEAAILHHWPAIRAALDRIPRLEGLAKELAEFAIDAAYQGSGQKPLETPYWHSFISTWEEADQLFRRPEFRALLDPELRAWLEGGEVTPD